MSFEVPVFLASKAGEKFVQLANGQLGSMVHFIEGEAPDLSRQSVVKQYGNAAGELCAALRSFRSKLNLQELHFHQLFSLHPLGGEQSVKQFLQHPPFGIDAKQKAALGVTLQSVREQIPKLDRLPRQIVHHDLLSFNMLFDSGKQKITGILDFDFASFDIGALELAICINHLLQTDDSTLATVQLFLDEYSLHMKLSEVEIRWIPFLMEMYHASLLCIYIGQSYSGKEVADYFRYIADQLVIRRQWLEQHEGELVQMLRETVV